MFGIGFTELLLISIIAILFLGPDKLPGALVEMGKFIKSVKKTVSEAKNSLEEEMKIADLKEEALNYKKQLNDATDELKGFKNLSLEDLDDVSYDDEISDESPMEHVKSSQKEKESVVEDEKIATQVEPKNDTVTLKKKPKKKETKIASKNKDKKNDKKSDA
jgi:sec-independent protein translocase protein TatB